MSYCRWSSDNGQCDLYCYEDCNGGFTTHVATRRKLFGLPNPMAAIQWGGKGKVCVFLWRCWYRAWSRGWGFIPWRDLGLPHDGETFNDPDLRSFRERLVELRKLGYKFPDYVFETVDREIGEAGNHGSSK